MDTNWYNKLIGLLNIQTNSENEKLMVLYLDKELKKLKLEYTIDAVGNILVTKGKAKTYPCVVSHMDTVHDFVDDFRVYKDIDDNDILFALNGKQRVGIGGDDKCGVFGCLYLLKTIPQIKIVFFSREEGGCKGSSGIDKGFFADCRYLIELDRNGSRDFIQTYWGKKTISHEFSSGIGLIKKKYKYKNCTGTVTDVMKLWNNKVGISCINLSCGYYKPHSAYEYVSISDLWHSVKFTEAIINGMQPKRYVSLPPEPVITEVSYVGNYQSKYSQCHECKKWKKETSLSYYKAYLICWSCKLKHKKMDAGKQLDNDIILFACHECGITTAQMKKGDSLRYIGFGDKHLYCNGCASLFSVPGGYEKPKECFVCNKIIPKDHKIIERFGVRVCEDCALPSDDGFDDIKS